MRARLPFVLVGLVVGLVFNALAVVAWTGPQNSPPICVSGQPGCDPPINVGTTAQIKNGAIGFNNFSAFGNGLLSGLGVGTGRYLNFDYTSGGTSGTGSAGYGMRDNAGVIEFKNLGGSWASLQSIISGFAGFWSASGANISNTNTGNVGIGTAGPVNKLHVYGTAVAPSTSANNGVTTIGVSNGVQLSIGVHPSSPYGVYLQTKDQNNAGPYNYPLLLNPINGNVGIGTPSPGAKLHVVGTSGTEPAVYGYNNSGYIGVRGWSNTSVGGYFQSAGANYGIHGESAGNYGIYGRSSSASYGGVLGYNSAGNSFGILGYGASYSFYGSGTLYNGGAAYATSFLYLSDRRLKENIAPLDEGLITLMKLRPVSFTWNAKADGGRAGKDDIGFIAQEVEKIVPEAVSTDTTTQMKAVDYPKLVPILVKAIQEQQRTIDELKKIACADHPAHELCSR